MEEVPHLSTFKPDLTPLLRFKSLIFQSSKKRRNQLKVYALSYHIFSQFALLIEGEEPQDASELANVRKSLFFPAINTSAPSGPINRLHQNKEKEGRKRKYELSQ